MPESYAAPNIFNASLGAPAPPPLSQGPEVRPNMVNASMGVYSPQPNVYSPQPAVVYSATRDSFKIASASGKNSGPTSSGPELDMQAPNSAAPAYESPTKDPESASNDGMILRSPGIPVSRQGP